jgi:hypothetical protein
MNVKTSELSGAALDWAVEVAIAAQFNEGRKLKVVRDLRSANGPCWIEVENSPGSGIFHRSMRSTDWSQGGPIIDSEDITWSMHMAPEHGDQTRYCAFSYRAGSSKAQAGPTKLTAAMRCFVANHLGDEVDVPEDLQ